MGRDGTLSSEYHNFRTAWRIVRELFGSTPAEEFGRRKLREVQTAMVTLRKQNGDGWCRKNINKQIGRVRLVFSWAVVEEIVPVHVVDALKHVRGLRRGEQDVRESETITSVPQDEVDAIKPHVSRQVLALIQLQLLTGARSSELLNLRPVDFQNTSTKVWLVELGDHKTAHHGRRRTLYFGPNAQEVLQPFLADRPVDKPLFSPVEAEFERRGTTDFNTKHPPGDVYKPRSYRRAIWRACLTAHPYTDEMTKQEQKEHRERWCWHPHQLRHNYGTMIRKTFSLEEAQNMLDHSSVEMTRVYAERDREQALEIARQVG